MRHASERSVRAAMVDWGLIGAVLAIGWSWPDLEMASDSARLAWLVTMNTTGPAPMADGETDTRWSLMYTVTLTGLGGRGSLAK